MGAQSKWKEKKKASRDLITCMQIKDVTIIKCKQISYLVLNFLLSLPNTHTTKWHCFVLFQAQDLGSNPGSIA